MKLRFIIKLTILLGLNGHCFSMEHETPRDWINLNHTAENKVTEVNFDTAIFKRYKEDIAQLNTSIYDLKENLKKAEQTLKEHIIAKAAHTKSFKDQIYSYSKTALSSLFSKQAASTVSQDAQEHPLLQVKSLSKQLDEKKEELAHKIDEANSLALSKTDALIITGNMGGGGEHYHLFGIIPEKTCRIGMPIEFEKGDMGQERCVAHLKEIISKTNIQEKSRKLTLYSISQGTATVLNYVASLSSHEEQEKLVQCIVLESPLASPRLAAMHFVQSNPSLRPLSFLPFYRHWIQFGPKTNQPLYSPKGPCALEEIDKISPNIPIIIITHKDDPLTPYTGALKLYRRRVQNCERKINYLFRIQNGTPFNGMLKENGYQDNCISAHTHCDVLRKYPIPIDSCGDYQQPQPKPRPEVNNLIQILNNDWNIVKTPYTYYENTDIIQPSIQTIDKELKDLEKSESKADTIRSRIDIATGVVTGVVVGARLLSYFVNEKLFKQ